MIVASGLSNVDYDYIPRRDVAEEDLVHDGRFIAVLANAPVTEDPVEMLFDAIEADDSARVDACKHEESLDEEGVNVNRFWPGTQA